MNKDDAEFVAEYDMHQSMENEVTARGDLNEMSEEFQSEYRRLSMKFSDSSHTAWLFREIIDKQAFVIKELERLLDSKDGKEIRARILEGEM